MLETWEVETQGMKNGLDFNSSFTVEVETNEETDLSTIRKVVAQAILRLDSDYVVHVLRMTLER